MRRPPATTAAWAVACVYVFASVQNSAGLLNGGVWPSFVTPAQPGLHTVAPSGAYPTTAMVRESVAESVAHS